MRTGRNQFSQYLTYNPDLRERAIVDRIYHSFKNTPYANRRLIVQAVQFSEVRQYTRNFTQDKLKFTKLSAGTRKALSCVTTAGILAIPSQVPTYSSGSLSFFRDDSSLIDQFLKFGGAHRNGRLCCKLFKGGDIGLIYELLFHWRTIFKKELGRVKSVLGFTYSHLTLNNTGEGWEVRLPSNHTLTEGEEDQLRDFALSYSNLFDDVIALKVAAGSENEKEVDEEDSAEPEEDTTAEDIIKGLGGWQDEHD